MKPGLHAGHAHVTSGINSALASFEQAENRPAQTPVFTGFYGHRYITRVPAKLNLLLMNGKLNVSSSTRLACHFAQLKNACCLTHRRAISPGMELDTLHFFDETRNFCFYRAIITK